MYPRKEVSLYSYVEYFYLESLVKREMLTNFILRVPTIEHNYYYY